MPFLKFCLYDLLILSRLYPSALTSPVWLEALPPPLEAVVVAVAAVVPWALVVPASAVAEAMVVHLHSLLVVAGKSNETFQDVEQVLTCSTVTVEATVAAVAEATLLTDEPASHRVE